MPAALCQDFLKKSLGSPGIKNISKKRLTEPLSSVNLSVMKNKWTPRSLRWNDAERQAKKIQAKNNREIRLMFWRESQAFREQIQKEISQKVLAKREAIE